MSHEITQSDGFFAVRLAAWHGLGTLFEDYPDRKTAQNIAHPWEPTSVPLFRRQAAVNEAGEIVESFETVDGWVGNVRDDNDDLLGVVPKSYTLVTNNELWDIAEALEKSGSDVMFETGGSLRGGAQVFVLVRLRDPLVVKGDPRGETIPYFALQNSHDGSGAFRGQATMTRIVCANTAKVADLDARARGTEFTFRHTKNVGDRVSQAQEALAGWRQSLEDWQEQAETLINLKVPGVGASEFLDRFIPMPPTNLISDRVAQNVTTARSQWLESYNGITGEGIKGTAYGLVQASIEFAEWHRKANSAENRFRRSFLSKDRIVSDAVALAIQATKVDA